MKDARELQDMPPHADVFEAICMVLLCFGWFIVSALTPAGRGCYTIGYISGATDNSFAGLLLFDVMAAATPVAVLWGRAIPCMFCCRVHHA